MLVSLKPGDYTVPGSSWEEYTQSLTEATQSAVLAGQLPHGALVLCRRLADGTPLNRRETSALRAVTDAATQWLSPAHHDLNQRLYRVCGQATRTNHALEVHTEEKPAADRSTRADAEAFAEGALIGEEHGRAEDMTAVKYRVTSNRGQPARTLQRDGVQHSVRRSMSRSRNLCLSRTGPEFYLSDGRATLTFTPIT